MRFALPVLLSALVACSSDVEAQLDDLADDLDALADENDELSAQIDELTSENAALSAELDALSQAEPEAAPVVPFVYFSQVYDSNAKVYNWVVRVDGEGITRSEATLHTGVATTDGLIDEASGGDCMTMQSASAGYVLWVWVWQGDVLTCHSSYDDRCFPIWGSSSVDEC
jgi:hypothetical protein